MAGGSWTCSLTFAPCSFDGGRQLDMLVAMERSKPTVGPDDLKELDEWTVKFGSEG